MDTTWFAVDENGHVAVFDTDEDGYMPKGFYSGGESSEDDEQLEDIFLLARILRFRARADERLRALLPETLGELEEAIENSCVWELVDPLLRSVGVWVYKFPTRVYVRRGRVPDPIHIDQIDEDMRAEISRGVLPVRFQDAPMLAPGEHVPVVGWGAAWFDSEGQIHPLEGKDEQFRELHPSWFEVDNTWRKYVNREMAKAQHRPVLEGEFFYKAVEELLTAPSYAWSDRRKEDEWWYEYLS